ncbi:MAG TPA: MarR family transcriptional regulator [Gemmatimonadaceae bacterium]|nr:MarR family transcriptional regulator [Gemmatimonadaceae bacterium]
MNNRAGKSPVARVVKGRSEGRGEAMFILLEAARSIQERLERVLGDVGLSSAKYQALDALVQAGEPITLSELAGRLRCVRSNITQLVDRLEADGLVKRVSDPADRRAVRAVVTRLGVERHAAGADAIGRLQAELAARVDPADRALFHRVLSAMR